MLGEDELVQRVESSSLSQSRACRRPATIRSSGIDGQRAQEERAAVGTDCGRRWATGARWCDETLKDGGRDCGREWIGRRDGSVEDRGWVCKDGLEGWGRSY
jgi:hypothetical protein